MLAPNGGFGFIEPFIPLTVQTNLTRGLVSFTAGYTLTAYMEAGPIKLSCRSEDGTATQLFATLTGLLVPQ
jgi:hypothetical protein